MPDQKKSSALHLTDGNFQTTLDQAAQDGRPVFVDFYADWCGPCKMAAPVVDKLAGEYQGRAVVAKLNVDESPASAQKYGVMSIPTVVMFKAGQEVERKVGFPGEAGFKQMIDKVL